MREPPDQKLKGPPQCHLRQGPNHCHQLTKRTQEGQPRQRPKQYVALPAYVPRLGLHTIAKQLRDDGTLPIGLRVFALQAAHRLQYCRPDYAGERTRAPAAARSATPPAGRNGSTLSMTARELAEALGGRWRGGYGTARCPAHPDKTPSLTIRDGHDSVLLTCHADCDRSAIIAALKSLGLWPDRATSHCAKSIRRPTVARTAPAPVIHATLAPWGQRLWSRCRPITPDDPAGRYLLARGCILPHHDGDLRWHPALKHPSGHVGPALVGLVTAILDVSRRINLHRTWITSDGSGRKAFDPLPKDDERPKARLVLSGHTTRGGCIRLWPDDAAETQLTVGEGIELPRPPPGRTSPSGRASTPAT